MEKNNKNKEVKLTGKKSDMNKALRAQKIRRQRKMRKQRRIRGFATLLAIASIGVGGYTLNDMNKTSKELDEAIEQVDNFMKENGIDENDTKTEKEKFMDSIVVDKSTLENSEVTGNKEIIDQILEKYNSNMPEETEKISKEDIGIIKENLGNGNIYKETDENGNTKYIQNHQEGQNGNLEWIDEQNIGDVIAVIDKENHTTIAGIGEIEGKYVPVEIKQMILSQDAQNPYKESEYYVKLKGSEKNYTRLNKAYQKRLKEIEAKSKQDTEMEIS